MVATMLTEQVKEQARDLARAHRKSDPELIDVYVMPRRDEVWIVEVSGAAGYAGVAIPFRFRRQPDKGLPLDTVVVLLSPEEFEAIKDGDLDLPEGWSFQQLEKVDLDVE